MLRLLLKLPLLHEEQLLIVDTALVVKDGVTRVASLFVILADVSPCLLGCAKFVTTYRPILGQ